MAIALDRNATKVVKLAADADDPNGTEFTIGRIDGPVYAVLMTQVARMAPDSEMGSADATAIRDVLIHGLRGWKNFRDGDGREVEFERTSIGASIASVGRLSANDAMELAGRILEFQRLTKAEVRD